MKRLIGVSPLLILILACAPAGGGDAPPPEDAAKGEPEEAVHVEPADLETWGIEVGSVAYTDVTAEIELPGVLTINENRTARISPLVEGQVAGVMVDLGDRVGQGEVLATVNAPEFTAAQTRFMQAYAQAELSQKDYQRAIILRNEQAIEEREFLRRQALTEENMAEMRAAEVFLHSLGIEEARIRRIAEGLDPSNPLEDHSDVEPLLTLRSPLSGVVLTRNAVLGDHVGPGTVLFTVSDLSTLWARLDAYEHQMAYISPDASVVIRTPLLPEREFPGRISFVADQVDEELRTVRVRVEVSNPDGALRPNMFVQGFLRVTTDGAERMVVPTDAVQLLDGEPHVFVKGPPEPGEDHVVFQAVPVTAGDALTVGTIILGGLEGTEEIVTRGAFTLKAEMTKGAGGHQHVH